MRFLLLFTLWMGVACHPRMPSILKPTPQDISQISGHFTLKAKGAKRFLGRVELDIIAQNPHRLYLSIGSFFGQPARVITYDGAQIYGVSKEQLEEITQIPVEAPELVDLLLRRPPKGSSFETAPLTGQITKIEREGLYSVNYARFPEQYDFEVRHNNKTQALTLTSSDVQLNTGDFNEQLFRR